MRARARAAGRKFDDELTSSRRAARVQRESDRSLQSTRASEPSAWMDRLVIKMSTNMPDLPSCGSRLVVQTLTLLALPETELAELVNPPSASDGGPHAGG